MTQRLGEQRKEKIYKSLWFLFPRKPRTKHDTLHSRSSIQGLQREGIEEIFWDSMQISRDRMDKSVIPW